MAAPTIDAMERQTIQVYQQAAPAVVTLWAGNGTGAGVLLHPSGLLVTNQHVIGNPKRIQIKLYTGQRLHGKLLATSAGQGDDLALVQIIDVPAGTVFPTLPLLPDAEVPVVGQRVLAIGNPFGLEQTLSQGILSRIDHHKNRLQTDAAINPGNSGGPLLNLRGQLLGVNAAIYNPLGRNNTGIAFAVPVATIRKFLTQQRIAH
jgi:S1-C subfamily serine protease